MKKLLLLTIINLLVVTSSIAQQSKNDSLNFAIANANHDTTRCDIYLNWGEEIYFEFPDSAVSLWQKAEVLSEKNISLDKTKKKIYLIRLANALSDIGTVYHHQGKISQALECLYKGLKVCEELNQKSAISITLNNIGAIYFDQEDFPKALDCYEKSLKINKELNDKRWIGNLLNNIASIYDHQGNQTKALECLYEFSLLAQYY